MSEIKEKNIDQSNKSVDGNKLNVQTENLLDFFASKSPDKFIKLKKEFAIKSSTYMSTDEEQSDNSAKIDNLFLLRDTIHKKVLINAIDNTITPRLDRINSKAQEARKLKLLKEYLIQEIIKEFPALKDFEFYLCFLVITVDKIDINKYAYPEREERCINRIIRNGQHNLSIDFKDPDTGKTAIDMAMRIGEFETLTLNILQKVEKEDILSCNVYQKLHKETYNNVEYRKIPVLSLTADVEALGYNRREYNKDVLFEFLRNNSTEKFYKSKLSADETFEEVMKLIQECQRKKND